jgi:Zn-dependent M28 family amino/carboxypeptidase
VAREYHGTNDNGSGTSTILETALQMAELDVQPQNQVRFAFWGAEEDGLIGSQYYVDHLPKHDLKSIMLNLNFDMVGSPNFVRFVYDGDGSAFGTDGPSGSGAIEDVFVDYFTSQGLATDPTEFDGRSDYDAFINAGIPAGGLFTGAEGIKTAAQAAPTVARPASRTTRATTRRATPSPTSARPPSTRCRTRPRIRHRSSPWRSPSTARTRTRRRAPCCSRARSFSVRSSTEDELTDEGPAAAGPSLPS